MAKKSTRGRRKRQVSQERVEPKPATVAEMTAPSPTADLADEYSYVFADLRRIGLIAAAMFVLLFALGFVLR